MVKKMLTEIKLRLSTLNRDAWHARLAKFAFGRRAFKTTKACPYWWLIVPSSLPVAGLKLVFFGACVVAGLCVAMLVFLFYPLVMAGWWFCGYKPTYWAVWRWAKKDANEPDYRPYKEDMRFAPWQLFLPLALIGAFLAGLLLEPAPLHSGTNAISDAWPIASFVVAGIATLAILGIIYRQTVAPILKRKYSEWCPEISWSELEEEEDAAATAA